MYRTYETLVRDAGKDPKELEAGMDAVLSSEMTMIRQFRNFLSHTPDPGFLEPTDKMLGVLERQVRSWSMKGDVAKKHVKPVRASVCDETDTCAEAVARMAKLKRTKIAVRSKDGKFTVRDIYAAASAAVASKNAKLSTIPVAKEKPAFVRPDMPAAKIDPSRVTLCTADGTPAGKLLGTVIL